MPKSTQTIDLDLTIQHQPGVTFVNPRCSLHQHDGVCVASVHGIPAFRFDIGDVAAERFFIAQALVLKIAGPGDLAAALGCRVRTIHRVREAYLADGIEGLVPKKRGPKGPRVGAEREHTIGKLRKQGLTLAAIVARVQVSSDTVRRTLERLAVADPALRTPRPVQSSLFEPQAKLPTEPLAPNTTSSQVPVLADVCPAAVPPAADVLPLPSLDRDADDRALDRLMAKQGMLDDAAPLFKNRMNLAHAGVLLVVPLLIASGVLEAGRASFKSLGPAFYGLRTSLMTMLFMSFLRIKNAESLKLDAPPELGWLLGLDRGPEMKTLRRKLAKMGDDSTRTEGFLERLLMRRAASRNEALGYLYFDGHVRVYSGKVEIPKAHVARMRMALPATQDLWVNDADGTPLFFMTQPAHGQLVSELPGVMAQVRLAVGPNRRVTLAFDRGGWSPELFAKLDGMGFDVLTYRKGETEALPGTAFTRHQVPGGKAGEFYDLADIEVTVGTARLAMRQVTRRQPDGHQTHVVTTRRDLPAAEVARRMFGRWQQENFFKYMRQEFAIDALVQYATEPDDPKREVPNPARKPIEKQLRVAKAQLYKLQAAYGAAALDAVASQLALPQVHKPSNSNDTTAAIQAATTRVAELAGQRKALPERVPLGQARPDARRLAPSRKRLSDGLKMLAYQVETDLARMVAPHYKRNMDDGRKLIVAALKSAGHLELQGGELRVTLRPQSSPHRSRAIAALCQQLDETETCFPGTSLRLRYAVEGFGVTQEGMG